MEDAVGPPPEERHVPSDSVKLDDVLADIRERVEGRRRAGVYPPGLEADLEAHFQRVVGDRVAPERSVVAARYSRLATMPAFNPARIQTKSRMPGGGFLHRLIGRLVHRQTQGVLEQVQEFATDVRELFEAMLEHSAEETRHGHPDLSDRIDMVIDRLAVYERAPASSALGTGELEHRIEQLESAEARRHFRPWFSQERFEQSLRGTREDLLDRYRDLANLLVGLGPVVDIGCGRGEFLSLLRDLGVDASGVEIDDALVRQAQVQGLAVERADALGWVSAAPDASLGGIVLIQVIEHLTPQEASELVLLSVDKLRPGGRMVVETVNPMSLYVYAHSFWADPDHDHLVHPEYLRFLFEEAGFSDVDLMWRSPPPEEDVLQVDDEDDGLRKANVDRLNRLLFSPTDYIMIATK